VGTVCEFRFPVFYGPTFSLALPFTPKWLSCFFVISCTFAVNIISKKYMTSGVHYMRDVWISRPLESLKVDSGDNGEECLWWVTLSGKEAEGV